MVKQQTNPPPQALIIADTFEKHFQPVTNSKPLCLMPLCNIPLIEYVLEGLFLADIKEIYIACRYGYEAIRQFIEGSRWTNTSYGLQISFINSQNWQNIGDVLREVDSNEIIRGDFVLTSAFTVTNVDIKNLIKVHDASKKMDSNITMTMALSPMKTEKRNQHQLYVMDDNMDLLEWKPFSRREVIKIDHSRLKGLKTASIRSDLIDPRLACCTPEVLHLFTENFDYQDLMQDFVKGILDSDVFANKFHCYVLSGEYAVSVMDPLTYSATARDIMGRWAYPLVPEMNNLPGHAITYGRRHQYTGENVVLARSVKLGAMVIVGGRTVVGKNTTISDSIIGENCVIGENCHITNSHLWNGCHVANNVTIDGTLLADACRILENVTISAGTIIEAGVIIGPSVQLPTGGLAVEAQGIQEDSQRKWSAQEVLGAKTTGVVQTPTHKAPEIVQNTQSARLLSVYSEDEESDTDSVTSKFNREAVETVTSAIQENHTIDNASLELNSLKLAFNASFTDCIEAISESFVQCLVEKNMTDFSELMEKWGGLFNRFTHSTRDRFFLIEELGVRMGEDCWSHLLPILYREDLIDTDIVLEWYNTLKDTDARREQTSTFIEWLEDSD